MILTAGSIGGVENKKWQNDASDLAIQCERSATACEGDLELQALQYRGVH